MTPWAVGSGARKGIFLPIEIDYSRLLKTSKEDSDDDIDLFDISKLEKILKARDPKRFGPLTREGLNEALRDVRRRYQGYIDEWERVGPKSPRQSAARDGFRSEYTTYLVSQMKVAENLQPIQALEHIVVGLRKNKSPDQVARGLNRLYKNGKNENAQEYNADDCMLIFEYIKFSNHPAYKTWIEVEYKGDEIDTMLNELMIED
ncbi:MAG: hypothetical protein L6R40_000768 [Gallowayella cf. fulva]|nr:MAG: hypothetical protein L6R40_000768 [Xanthomendoza cf. fulva]